MNTNNKKIILVTSVPETLFYFYQPLISQLKKEHFSITLVSSEGSWVKRDEVEIKLGIPIIQVPFKRNFSLLGDLLLLVKLVRLFIKINPSILHASTPKAAFLSLIAGFFARVPFRIYSVRGLIAYGKPFLKKTILHRAEWIACALAHTVIANSESNREYLSKNSICPKGKIFIMGNGSGQGVNSAKFSREMVPDSRISELRNLLNIQTDKFVFGFVGRLVKDKGVEVMASVWHKFTINHPDAILLIIGPIHEPHDRISSETDAILKNTTTIRYAGEQKESRDFYALMDVLLLPSFREGFPNVVLEAYAMEIAVITTDAPGCIDSIQNGKTGFCIKAGSAEDLYSSMEILINDPVRCKAMGKAGREWVVDKFQPDMIVNDLVKIYKST